MTIWHYISVWQYDNIYEYHNMTLHEYENYYITYEYNNW